jgi:hypothetical protein
MKFQSKARNPAGSISTLLTMIPMPLRSSGQETVSHFLLPKFTITEDSFWNINYFEDLTKYVFWTFNKSFLLKVTDRIELLTLTVLKRCQELLQENGAAYNGELLISADEEPEWCLVKNENLKKDPKFSQMYRLDEQNRSTILKAVKKE